MKNYAHADIKVGGIEFQVFMNKLMVFGWEVVFKGPDNVETYACDSRDDAVECFMECISGNVEEVHNNG